MANWKKVIVSGSAAELASLSLDTALTVANGGTGASTLTDGGVLLGSGTGAVTPLGQATNGQLVIGSTGGDPTLATLTGGANITVTNTAGAISIAATGLGSGTVQSVSATGTENGITLTSDGDSVNPTLTLGGALTGVTNSQLTNSSVSYGGVTVALGASDATPAFDLSDATSLPLGTGTTGTLAISRGGTNITSYSTGDILYASAANTLSKLNIGSTGEVLSVSAGGVVEWTAPTTGDITGLTSGSGITITSATGPVPNIKVNYAGANNIILEAQDLSSSTVATSDKIIFSDGSSDVSFANVSDLPFTNNSGDIESVANATNGGIGVTSGTGPNVTLAMDISNLSAASIDVAADSLAILDANDSNLSKKSSFSAIMTAVAGTGLTATSGVLSTTTNPQITASIYTGITGDVSITAGGVSSVNSVQANSVALGTDTTGDYVANLGAGTGVTIASNTGEGSTPTIAVNYGSSANNAVEGDITLAVLGTTNEIEVSSGASAALGAGNRSITVGLPNDVTITNNLTVSNNAIISGDLTVSGTASFTHSDNLDIADKFITLSSGSTSATDGGIIVAQGASGATQFGEAFGFNAQAGGNGRWGITGSLDNDAGAIVALDQMVTVRTSTVAPVAVPIYGGTSGYGNMHVDTATADIYIYA